MTASHRAQSTIDKSITPPTAQDADRHAASLSGQHDKPAALTLDECRDHLDAGEITLLRWCFEDAGSDGREGYGRPDRHSLGSLDPNSQGGPAPSDRK
jgi:hypothetical protein